MDNIAAAWIRYAQALIEGGNTSAGLKSLDRAEEFVRKTGGWAAIQSNITELRRIAAERGKGSDSRSK